jgi:hypothetical protein
MSLSIDIETQSSDTNAVILSVGCVEFSTKNGHVKSDYFYEKADPARQPERHTCPNTLDWWNKQHESVRTEAFSGTLSLEELLVGICHWFDSSPTRKNQKVWVRGSNFDDPILRQAFKNHGLVCPWAFWSVMDIRVLEYMASRRKLTLASKTPEGKAHNALQDAIHQAGQVTHYHEILGL